MHSNLDAHLLQPWLYVATETLLILHTMHAIHLKSETIVKSTNVGVILVIPLKISCFVQ